MKCGKLQDEAEYQMLWKQFSWTWGHGHGVVWKSSQEEELELARAGWEKSICKVQNHWVLGSITWLHMAPSGGAGRARGSAQALERERGVEAGGKCKERKRGGLLATLRNLDFIPTKWGCRHWLHFGDWTEEAQCWRKGNQWRYSCPDSDKYS